ncbi:MAG: sulfatase-like hydrolase/transferase [Bryobacteraceae bacterium]
MTRRDLLRTAAAVPALSYAQPAKPNVVLIMTDDQGWFDLGVNGNPHIRTPNIDRLAAEGCRFTNFYCSPVCSPTRASLMTGRHYQRTGAIDTFLGRDVMDQSEVTMGQVFQKAGYRTGCTGKWHLGRYMRYHPNERGFDEYFGFWQYGFINRYEDSDELWDNKRKVRVHGYVTDVLTNGRSDLFATIAASLLPVPALQRASTFRSRTNTSSPIWRGLPLREARIYGMVTCIDENVGRLLKEVDKNTIVIFMTDNGGVSNFHKAGLRAGKGTCYEGGIRAPFIARWPENIPAGAVTDAMAQHIDVLPTLCELVGIAPPSGRALDGKSIASILGREGESLTIFQPMESRSAAAQEHR